MSVIPSFHDSVNNDIVRNVNGECEVENILFSMLNEIHPSAYQRKQMISFTVPSVENKDPFVEIKKSTDTCNSMLERIREIICSKNNSLDNEMTNIQAILNPRQQAKFILWIDQNPAITQMLEALWPHINNGFTGSAHNSSGNLASENSSSSSAQQNNHTSSSNITSSNNYNHSSNNLNSFNNQNYTSVSRSESHEENQSFYDSDGDGSSDEDD
eukprot:gene29523-36589_t